MTDLVVRNLSVMRGAARLIDNISFSTSGGEFIGIIGPNGAGKSTLLKAVVGIDPPGEGAVTLNRARLKDLAPRERARLIAYLPQNREVHWSMTAEAVVSLGRFAWGQPSRLGPADRAAVDRALAATDSESFRSRVASMLSGGEQARMHLARALAAEAPILIADEPTAALDLSHTLSILAALRAKTETGCLVIAALHDIALARRYCSRLMILNKGRLVADGPPEETLTAATLACVFKVAADDLAGAFAV